MAPPTEQSTAQLPSPSTSEHVEAVPVPESSPSISVSAAVPDRILRILRQAFDDSTTLVVSYDIQHEIIQDNARGYKVHVLLHTTTSSGSNNSRNNDSDTANSSATQRRRVFVKQVLVTDYLQTKADWADLRRTLLYARTEARFYRDIAPLLHHAHHPRMTPHVFLATYDLDGWIRDEEATTAPPASSTYPAAVASLSSDNTQIKVDISDPRMMMKGGWIVLDCVDELTHYQESPLTVPQSVECLQAVARLHAAAWQNVSLLETCQEQLSKASFHLSMRNPKELAGIVESWKHFANEFQDHFIASSLSLSSFDQMNEQPTVRKESLTSTPKWVQLGHRIQKLAVYISNQVSPGPRDPFATLIHGDYKALNVFLPRNDVSDTTKSIQYPILVDFASVGIGFGMSDLAMHVRHAVRPNDLEEGGEERLVRHYWEYLHTQFPLSVTQHHENDRASSSTTLSSSTALGGAAATSSSPSSYTWEVAWRHYKFALVDYFRFFLGRMWKNATPATMAQKANNPNINLINRDIPAAMAFLRTVERYLTEIEVEYNESLVIADRPSRTFDP